MTVLASLLQRSGYDPLALQLDGTPAELARVRRSLRLRGCAAWRTVRPAGEAVATERLVADVLRAVERDDTTTVAGLLRHLAARSGEPSLTAALALDAVVPSVIVEVLAAVEDGPCR
jgi:hypothetical protein